MEENEQSFIVQGAKTSLSHGLTPQIPKALVSKTLHQYFSPSKASVSPQKPSESYQEQTAQKADALVQLHADTTSILVNLGLSQSFAPLPGIRKAGRPPGVRDVCPRKKGFAGKAEPTAAVKLRPGNEFLQRRKQRDRRVIVQHPERYEPEVWMQYSISQKSEKRICQTPT